MTQDPTEPTFTRGRVPIDDDEVGLDDAALEERRPPGERTPLEVIADELAEDVDLGSITLDVPARAGYKVRFRCDVSYDELVDWRDRASGVARNRAERRKPTAQAQAGKLNELKMAAFVILYKAEAIVRHGVDVADVDGGPLTFTSEALLRMVSASTAAEAVRRFYGVDGHVSAAANRVLIESGWTDAVLAGDIEAPADPTPA